ncbi:MAG: class I SAM-dependent methyltransferase [Negativicutes bacterium]
MNCIVTTIRKQSTAAEALARRAAAILQVPYIERDGMGIDTLRCRFGIDTVIVATQTHPIASTSNGDYFFHLSMAELRIKKLLNTESDHMISAMNLQTGQSVLDCTLGMGTDAIVASYVAGSKGRVVGLEASAIISLITSWGLQNFIDPDVSPEILAALRQITVQQTDYFSYLKSMPDDSFDVVYFDPMFRRPVANSITLKPLRELANKEALNPEVLIEACRVASQRVVIKETSGSLEFNRLGITHVTGGKYSSIQYGVIHTGGTAWKN